MFVPAPLPLSCFLDDLLLDFNGCAFGPWRFPWLRSESKLYILDGLIGSPRFVWAPRAVLIAVPIGLSGPVPTPLCTLPVLAGSHEGISSKQSTKMNIYRIRTY